MDRKAINLLTDVSCVIGKIQIEVRYQTDRIEKDRLIRIQNHLEAAVLNYLEVDK